jgi:integrase
MGPVGGSRSAARTKAAGGGGLGVTQLRVHWGDGDDAGETDKSAAIAKRPELGWRLREFCENWFSPRYLKKRVSETTRNYLSSIRYWEAITDDWRLVDFAFDREGADKQALDFTDQLPEWGYSRRAIRRGEPIRIGRVADYPAFTPLSAMTAREHASRIATLFRKAGPELDNRHHYAELLPRAPRVEILPADFEQKNPFTWGTARAIAAAASRMRRPALPAGLPVELWWRVRLSTLFYTGLRMGTVERLCWSHVADLDGDAWLKVPKDLVKTRKRIEMPLHPQLVELLRQLRQLRPVDVSGDLIIPDGCGRRTLLDLHVELQELAGVEVNLRQGLHAWRRTHLSQIYELGAARGLEAAKVAADHADGRTTAQSYVATVVNHFRLRLPLLFD